MNMKANSTFIEFLNNLLIKVSVLKEIYEEKNIIKGFSTIVF